MPNRMLRDWTGSDKINSISVHAERFFIRLIMKADDYGCFYADTRLLKANLYPLLLDSIREADMLRWMAECQKAGLIVLYESNSKKYVQIIDFKQRLDKSRSKFPLPKETDFPEIVNDFPAELEVEPEVELEGNRSENPANAGDDFSKNIFSTKNQNEKKYISPGPEIEYPFNKTFLIMWGQWKEFKRTEFKFQYKSPQSEQAALNELVKLSGGVEQTAIEIIHQSMAKGWKGFFELKTRQNGIAKDKQPTGAGINTSNMVSRIMAMPDKAGNP